MANVFKLRKGLDINLKGKAVKKKVICRESKLFALRPSDFTGVVPKVVVREGDHVLAGDALFANKQFPEVLFASPVSGIVKSVARGERRRVLSVSVEADEKQEYRDFGIPEVSSMDGNAVKQLLLKAGLFGYINQLPYAISTNPATSPKGIFVSALSDMPLAADFEYVLKGNEEAFKKGLQALSRITNVHLGVGAKQQAEALTNVEGVDLNVFDGPCPAGNVGVQVNHIAPLSRGEVAWTVDPMAVIFIGRLFLTGKVDLRKTIAIAGSQVKAPAYVDVLVGAQLADIVADKLVATEHVRLINGNPLTGERATPDDFLGAHTSEIAFKKGLQALSRITNVHLGVGAKQQAEALTNVEGVDLNVFDGPCPAGNVGVQVNHIAPLSRGEVAWTVDPMAVIFIGRLFLTGKVDLRKTIAIAGSQVKAPAYVDVLVGAQLADIVADKLVATEHVRLINGNPLTGERATPDDFLGAHTSEITAIPEGDNKEEILGWILPRTNDFSVSRSYFSWLQGKKHEYDLDARVKGGERHMIMSGEYDKVLPMDIYAEYLIKAIIAGDIDKQEQLGIYEVSPEDFALAEFVDSSKLELQKIVRQGLDILRKENA